MGRNSYIGGSGTIKIRGTSSKPQSVNRNKSPSQSLLKSSNSVMSRIEIEKQLTQMHVYKKEGSMEKLYKIAIDIMRHLSSCKQTKKNSKFIDYVMNRLKELEIDEDKLKKKITDS